MSTLKDKAIQASVRYVERRGYEVIDVAYPLPGGEQIDIVAKDADTVVFIDVLARKDSAKGFPREDTSSRAREAREMSAIRWMQGCSDEYNDAPVRFDSVSLVVAGEHRAFIRHHINALGMMEPAEEMPLVMARSEAAVPELACATA